MKRRKRNTRIINIPLNISISTNSQQPAQSIDRQADNRKIAIDAYRFQVERYQTFMNYFALFNGALLVAFCTLLTSTTTITNIPNTCCKICFENKYILSNQYQPLLIMISILGIIVSIIWERSIIGNIAWMDSWMQHIKSYEIGDNEQTSKGLYNTIFSKDDPTVGSAITLKGFYSTQKLTLAFVRFVVGAWTIALLYIIYDIFRSYYYIYNYIDSIAIFIIGVICIFTLLILCLCKKCKYFYSDLSGMSIMKFNDSTKNSNE